MHRFLVSLVVACCAGVAAPGLVATASAQPGSDFSYATPAQCAEAPDRDKDGLNDCEEGQRGTSPFSADEDEDTVSDGADMCPGQSSAQYTGNGWTYTADGCRPGSPPDRDRDRVPDASDACPVHNVGTSMRSDGCPDGDEDGVVDPDDWCLRDGIRTSKPAPKVEADGCYPFSFWLSFSQGRQDFNRFGYRCDYNRGETCHARLTITFAAATARAMRVKRVFTAKVTLKDDFEDFNDRNGYADFNVPKAALLKFAKLKRGSFTVSGEAWWGSQAPIELVPATLRIGRQFPSYVIAMTDRDGARYCGGSDGPKQPQCNIYSFGEEGDGF